MEAVEFMRAHRRMCECYTNCIDCPAKSMSCEIDTDEPERLVNIVSMWDKEHPRESKKNAKNYMKTIQEDLDDAIYHAIASNKTQIEKLEYDVYVIRHNLAALHDKIFALSAKVDHTPTTEPSQTQEPKRTNKDVLLAAFPNARMDNKGIPDACPLVLDTQYDCNEFASCSTCKRAH